MKTVNSKLDRVSELAARVFVPLHRDRFLPILLTWFPFSQHHSNDLSRFFTALRTTHVIHALPSDEKITIR